MDYAFSTDALYDSFKDVKKNIRFKYSVKYYEMNRMKEITEFRKRYYEGNYKISKGKEFTINERGNIRRIKTTIFKDRIPIHSFCKNVLLKELRKYLIYDNCASLKGKGLDMQRDRFRVHLQKYFMTNHTNKGYILQGDFSKFFDNIIHEKAIKLIEEKINDKEVIDFLRLILKSCEVDVSYMNNEQFSTCLDDIFNKLEYSKNIDKSKRTGEKMMAKSVDIGNEVSQIIGVFYPTRIDTLVKNVLGFKFYGRYMDDFYIISRNKQKLKEALKLIENLSKELGLHLNKKKTTIKRLDKTIIFLKIKYNLTKTGKIFMRFTKERFIRERQKLRKLKNKLEKKEIEITTIINQYKSWKGTIERKKKIKGRKCKKPIYKNYNQLILMDKYYNNLFGSYI